MEKPWMNASLPVEERVELLLKEMTINEKVALMLSMRGYWLYERQPDDTLKFTQELIDLYKEFPSAIPGSWNRADWYTKRDWKNGLTPELIPIWHNQLQKYVLENTRLGIPLTLGGGIGHAIFALGGSVFPAAIGMASCWNRKLIIDSYDALADEGESCTAARFGCGGGPTQDLARDPRWSRVEETWGEDPFLSAEMTVAMADGLATHGMRLAIRHFLSYGETEGGHNSAPAHCGMNELFNIHLRPFEAGIRAGAGTMMTSYNLVDGIPCTISPLVEEVLRKKWGYQGVVDADAGAIGALIGQGFANDLGDAATLALKAGTDYCCWEGHDFKKGLKMALERGQLTDEDINVHVRRILRGKFKSGIFEHPYIEDVTKCAKTFRCKKSHDAALAIARELLILIKNDDNTLPLKNEQKLSVIGPNADSPHNQIGDYTAPQRPGDIITVKLGLEAMGKTVAWARGCGTRSMRKDGFDEALATIDTAEAVIAVLGGSSIPNMELMQKDNGEAVSTNWQENTEQDKDCGEGFDRANLHLGGVQLEFLRQIRDKAHAQGKKVITVLIMGRPLILTDICKLSDAVLLAWYPGMDGGTAIAETLFGKNNPSGKLPVTFPDHEGQIPVYYNTLKQRNNYVDCGGKPTYIFGTGLSYTTFAVSDVHMEKPVSAKGEQNYAVATITNTGKMAGKVAVQMYIRDLKFTIARPIIELKGFEKIELQPGESKVVKFLLGDKELGYYNRDLEYVTEPGDFKIWISVNGPDEGVETMFTLK